MQIDLFQGHHPVLGVEVLDLAIADLEGLGGVEQGVHVGPAGVEAGGDGEGLEHRAHFVVARDGAVQGGAVGRRAAIGRVEGRPGRHAQHLAGLNVGDDADGALGLVLDRGGGEFVFQHALDAQVDGQGEGLAALTRRADLVVEGQFGARDALPARVGVADQMDGRGPERIGATILGLEGDAAQRQVVDGGLFLGRQAGQGDQTTVAAQHLLQTLGRDARQGAADLAIGQVAIPDLGRVDVEAVVNNVGGQQLAIAVRQVAAHQGVRIDAASQAVGRGEQGLVRRADGQAAEDAGKDDQDQEDADAGVLFRAGVGAGALEAVLQPPDQFRQPAPEGRQAALQPFLEIGARRGAVIAMILNAHCAGSGEGEGVGTGASSATAAGAGAAAGADAAG